MVRVVNNKDFGPCPLCHGLNSKEVLSSGSASSEFSVVKCQICELARTFPCPTDESLHVRYIDTYYGTGENKFITIVQKLRDEIMRMRIRHYLSLIRGSIQKPKILDIGCAEGRLLKSFLEYGCQCWGIEHPVYPSHRFIDPDRIVYMQGDLLSVDLPEGAFDLILMWHVLEHMDDPGAVMSRLCRLLSPEGFMILAVPNFSSMEAGIFKEAWFHLDIPWHKYHFNERSLHYLVERNHLRIIKSSTLCFEQGPYGLLQNFFNSMGLPKNEFYEALKGNTRKKRGRSLVIQLFVVLFLFIPCSFISLLTSKMGTGPVLKMIFKKMNKLTGEWERNHFDKNFSNKTSQI